VGNTDILEADELFIDAIDKEHESTECEQSFAELELGYQASKVSFNGNLVFYKEGDVMLSIYP